MNRFSIGLAAAVVLVGLVPSRAEAHFKLVAPDAYAQQDSLGSPQKAPPCGDGTTLTNAVTDFEEGGTITITIDETITHPGHYRVAIAQDQASLPADPPVTAGATPCGTTVIEANPTLPLLADGQLVHTAAFGAPQTFQVQLPPGFTCTNCVLQVEEFMSNHGLNNPGGCFYHHCATVNVVAPGTLPDAGPMIDAAPGSTVDAAPGEQPDASDGSGEVGDPPGCGCRTHGQRGTGSIAGFLLLGTVLTRLLSRRKP